MKKILLFGWFLESFLKANPDKYHLLINSDENLTLKIKNETTNNTCNKKPFGILFNNKFDFDNMSLHDAGKPPRSQMLLPDLHNI